MISSIMMLASVFVLVCAATTDNHVSAFYAWAALIMALVVRLSDHIRLRR